MTAWGRGWGPRVSVLLLVLALFSGCRHAEHTESLTIQEIYAHDSIPSQRGQKVTLSATVTYSDPLWRLLMVQDASQGAYIPPPSDIDLHSGDRIQITGTTSDTGTFLDHQRFRVVAGGGMPEPVVLDKASQFADHAGVFAQIPATVRWSGIRNGRAMIEAYARDGRLTAIVYPGNSEDLPRIGSEIKIAGVTGSSTDSHGHFEEWRLLTPSAHYVQVVKAGPKDLFSVPVVQLSLLGDAQKGKLVHVAGKVTDRASALSLNNDGRSVSLLLRKPIQGDFVSAEVVGFWNGTGIEDGIIRPSGELLAHKGDIRTISDLKHLSVAEASARRPVSVRGIVTYFDPGWGLLFVQDQTSAVFVNTSAMNLPLKAGDLVDISGVSGPGDYAPVILEPAVSFVGHGTLPRPMVLDPLQSNLSRGDSHWVNLSGVVHSAQFVDGHTNLKLGAGEAAVNVQLPTLLDGQRFLDKEISVTGALGILFNERRQAIGHQIFVPAPEFITVVGTGGQPNAPSTIAMLRRYSPDFDEHHSVSFSGQVVLRGAPNVVFIQDETAGIQVRSVDNLHLAPGDRVQVRGFLRPGEYSPAVEDAVVTGDGAGSLPDPERLSGENLDEGRHDSEYVSMSGVLSAVRSTPANVTLVLNQKGTYFDVIGPADRNLSALRIGSEIEARGVFQVVLDRTHVPYTVSGFELAFDSPQSITVHKAGPWWDASKIRWTVILFGIFAGLAALWAIILRRQVLTRTSELQLSLAAKRKAQQFDHARNEVLETIARNAPLPESMERLALAIQEQVPESMCAVLMPPDGKSFVDGRPSPLFIAPTLPEEVQHSPAMLDVLQDAVKADDSHILAADEDLLEKIKSALKKAGLNFSTGYSTLVFSASGAVSGMLILLCRRQDAIPLDHLHQSMLQSASRLISLARDHWQMHERLLHEARHDGLTGLPNRMVAEDRLEQALARAERRRKSFAVLCIDLDGFKAVNDVLGHDAGDDLLRGVAVRLRGRIRHSDTLARMGGDEFLAIIEDCANDSAALSVADSLIASLQESPLLENSALKVSASIGVAMYPADGKNASQLRRVADQAMYGAKSKGGGQACFWQRVPDQPAKVQKSSSGKP